MTHQTFPHNPHTYKEKSILHTKVSMGAFGVINSTMKDFLKHALFHMYIVK